MPTASARARAQTTLRQSGPRLFSPSGESTRESSHTGAPRSRERPWTTFPSCVWASALPAETIRARSKRLRCGRFLWRGGGGAYSPPCLTGRGTKWGGLRFRKPFTLSRALSESPTPRPSPRTGRGEPQACEAIVAIRSEEGAARWRRFAASTPKSRTRFVCRRQQCLPEIVWRTYLCRHGETVQPNFKPPRAIEQAVGPDG